MGFKPFGLQERLLNLKKDDPQPKTPTSCNTLLGSISAVHN